MLRTSTIILYSIVIKLFESNLMDLLDQLQSSGPPGPIAGQVETALKKHLFYFLVMQCTQALLILLIATVLITANVYWYVNIKKKCPSHSPCCYYAAYSTPPQPKSRGRLVKVFIVLIVLKWPLKVLLRIIIS